MGGSCLEHIPTPNNKGAMFASMVRGDYKVVVGQNSGDYTPKLFNLAMDPGESHDIASQQPAKVTELMQALAEYAKGAGVAHDRDPIDPKSDPRLHGGVWMPWE